MNVDVLAGLNPAQVKAVQCITGPVLVVAGPGSGKTRVLTHRIAYLIGACGVPPYRILAVTFTNKAAREMISRLRELIGADTERLTMGTFHAICARILRREGARLGLSDKFAIFDQDDQQRLITRVLGELNLDSKQYRPSAVQGAISRAKNELITPREYHPPSYWHEAVARAYERYEEVKAASNGLDFDDLLLKAEQLFREDEEVRRRYQERYLHILVDEFQDTNKAQYELVRHLAGKRRNVFVVGDEDQSIYSWRGADFYNVLRFRDDYPDAQTHLLEQNYRSTQTILNAAQAVIRQNAHRTAKTLWTDNESGRRVRVFEAYDEREEAEYVVNELQRLVAQGETTLAECAVMYRTNAQSRALEDALVRHGIPYKLVGGTRFYQRREIKDATAYLRLAYNPDDEVSLLRIINVPRRGIGPKTLEELSLWAEERRISMGGALLRLAEPGGEADVSEAPFSPRSLKLLQGVGDMLSRFVAAAGQDGTLSELLQLILDTTEYLDYLRDGTEEGEDRANNVRELFTAIQRFDRVPLQSALPAFLEEASLATDVDEVDWESDAPTLLTLHTAKGLEFDTVFIVGMEEGICPHSRSMDDPNAMEEERRLCYVGITRAKRHLYLLRTFRRTLYGSADVREASRFLQDVPAQLVESQGARPTLSESRGAPTGRRERRDLFARRRNRVQRNVRQFQEDDRRSYREGRARAVEEPAPAPTPPLATARREPAFQTGESVSHAVFGVGTVIESKMVGDDEEVVVAFEGRGVKRLMASFARLQKNP